MITAEGYKKLCNKQDRQYLIDSMRSVATLENFRGEVLR